MVTIITCIVRKFWYHFRKKEKSVGLSIEGKSGQGKAMGKYRVNSGKVSIVVIEFQREDTECVEKDLGMQC